MSGQSVQSLVEASDLQGLLRAIDGFAEAQDWDGIVTLRDRCNEAVERGKQLWGVSQFAEYRLALDAPASYAGRVVREGAGRYALGPLWEVAASTHLWSELDPHLSDLRLRAFAAHERVLRGEAVSAADIDLHVVDLPLDIAAWDPVYPVAAYRSDRASFPERELPEMEWVELGEPGSVVHGDDAGEALLDQARIWIDESSGRGEARAVSGDAASAIRALGPRRVRMVEVGLDDAMAVMTWVGASGGAFGKRRGSPVGRAGAWWALACVLGLELEWPMDPNELATESAGLRWFVWDPGDRVGGWNYHLAVEDSVDGLAWAVSAVDWK
jgi:hypothetical protein